MLDRFDGHTHTMYSNTKFVDSLNVPERLIDRAIELGLKGIAITDHSCVGAHVRCNKYAEEIRDEHPDFKVALGEESYLCDSREKGQYYYHQIFIAKDLTGHKFIRELSSISWINGYWDRGIFRTPILRSEVEALIEKYGKGHVVATAACLAGRVNHHLSLMIEAEKENDTAKARENKAVIVDYLSWMRKWFNDDFYLEVAPGRSEEQLAVNSRMSSLANAFGFKVVCFSDSHYLSPEDRDAHATFLNSKSSGDREVDSFYHYAYLQSNDDMERHLDGCGLDFAALCANSMEIYDKIENYSLHRPQSVPLVDVKDYPKEEKHSPFPTLNWLYQSDVPQERYWVHECIDALKKKNLLNRQYLERLEEEARVHKIVGERLGTSMFAYPVFLQHYIDLMWECGSTIGAGRGSACSALCHWLLGITQLDPIKHNFPFWRYMNEATDEPGDVDLDLSPTLRPKIFEKIREQRGGETGIVQVCTYGTVAARSAVLNAARGMGIDNDKAQYLSSMVSSERGFTYSLGDMVNGNEEKGRKPNKLFVQEIGAYPGLLESAMKIEGIIDHAGIHASGVLFEPEDDPYEKTAYMRAPNGSLVTQYSLHDAEYMGCIKFDFLVTQVQDMFIECIKMLQEHNVIDNTLTLRQAYNKYLHPEVMPIDDDKLWDAIDSGKLLKCFQFEEQVGKETLRLLQPRTPVEFANCSSVMRLMAQEKGGETPAQRYRRMKNDMGQWYAEMTKYGLTKEERHVLEPYYLPAYGTPPQQEDLMRVLMDEKVCNFTLAEANAARKICSKKKMDKIEWLHEEVMSHASSEAMGRYVWDTCIKNQLGYAFSLIHSESYAYIGIQTAYLATYFNPVYWYCACLRVMSGLDEDDSVNYNKTARAIGEISEHGVQVKTIDINKSGYLFEPDEENGTILFGMKGLNGVGGEVISRIIGCRPYNDPQDFIDKAGVNKTAMISLIKAGAFDSMMDRVKCMKWYMIVCSEPKSKLTMANFSALIEKNLIPDDMSFERRLFNFNRGLKKNCKSTDAPGNYFLDGRYYDFYVNYFDVDELSVNGSVLLDSKKWDKMYAKGMAPAKKWLTENQDEILDAFNDTLFQEQWDRYATGNISSWEMSSLGFYSHRHELDESNMKKYGVVSFDSLPEQVSWPLTQAQKICGTVIAKNDMKSTIALTMPHGGVVDVKFNRDLYAYYNRRISEIGNDGSKHVVEDGWFAKGTTVIVCGYRRGNTFVAKAMKGNEAMYKLEIDKNYNIESIVGKRVDDER